ALRAARPRTGRRARRGPGGLRSEAPGADQLRPGRAQRRPGPWRRRGSPRAAGGGWSMSCRLISKVTSPLTTKLTRRGAIRLSAPLPNVAGVAALRRLHDRALRQAAAIANGA